MQIVGKIDIEKYKCVAQNIATDEVVITDERIAHIMQNHPGDYERFGYLMRIILEEPDYIIEDKKPRTAILLKEIREAAGRFRLILRLVTTDDNPEYKNSVLTFWRIHDSEWKRLINSKKILYKFE